MYERNKKSQEHELENVKINAVKQNNEIRITR